MFYKLVRTGQGSVVVFDGGQILQIVLNSARRGDFPTLLITTSSVFKVQMFFQSITEVGNAIETKTMKCSSSYVTETLLGYTGQKISKARKAFAQAANVVPLANMGFPDIFFDPRRKDFSY